MSQPVLTVLVPTREREVCARSALHALADIADPRLEVVVEDNSAEPTLGRYLAEHLPDPRIRYAHHPGPRSVAENCDAALGRAAGVFVSLIGDDDGINPELLDAARWAEAAGVDAVVPRLTAQYYWPDVATPALGAAHGGTLLVRPFGGGVERHDVAAGVRAATRGAFLSTVEAIDLPKLYYGLVRRSCFERLREAAGTYFPGVSPDVAAAVGVSAYVRSLVSVDYPLFLPGTSARSGAGQSERKAHYGRLEDQPHMPRDFARHWPVTVPMLYTVQSVWAQSGVRALTATHRDELAHSQLPIGYLHAAAATFNPPLRREIMANYWAVIGGGRRRVAGYVAYARGLARVWRLRAAVQVRRRLPKRGRADHVTLRNVPTIADATRELSAHLQARGASVARHLADFS